MTQPIYLDSIEDLQELFDGIQEDFEAINYTDYMVAEQHLMAELHEGYFQREAGPDGVAWPKNAPRTIREKGHSRILRGKPSNRYRLSRSLTERATQTVDEAVREAIQTDTGGWMTFGSLVPYGPFHDRDRGRIPARRHVGINDEHLDGMTERAADFTLKELAK